MKGEATRTDSLSASVVARGQWVGWDEVCNFAPRMLDLLIFDSKLLPGF